MQQPRALRLARLHWANGEPLPLDIAVELLALGFCISTLEARYGNT